MRMVYADHRYYRNNMIATCCVCYNKQSLPAQDWDNIQIGLDYTAFRCLDCTLKAYDEEAEKGAE